MKARAATAGLIACFPPFAIGTAPAPRLPSGPSGRQNRLRKNHADDNTGLEGAT